VGGSTVAGIVLPVASNRSRAGHPTSLRTTRPSWWS